MYFLLFLQNYKKNYEFHVYEIWELGNIMCFSSPCKFLERKRGTFYVRGLQNMTICCCESFTLQSKLCHLKLQQKLHYRNLVPSLKITSLIFWVNITYNAYCYSTINALALMLMLMFSDYLNNFPQHKKKIRINLRYVCKSEWFFSSSECSDACSITICAGVEGVSGPSYILKERERGLDTTIWKYEFKYYLSICPP